MIYDIGFFIFSLFYLPVLLLKGKLHGAFGERFGIFPAAKREKLGRCRNAIWIQAVSVGEVLLCRSLIPALKEAFPESDIVLSTITRTGQELAGKLFSKDAVLIYFPLDFSSVTDRVAALIRPKIYVMVETEIWPNLLNALSRSGSRKVMINGRISDRSYGKYMLVRAFLRPVLRKIDAFCMQSETDAGRIISMGAPKDRVKVTGSMKFDAELRPEAGSVDSLRSSLNLGAGGKLLVAGSTHRGEEAAVLSAYKGLIRDLPDLKLLIAPRHVERSAEVERVVARNGFRPVRLSFLSDKRKAPDDKQTTVFILDTIGRLSDAFSLATVVFIGGSLVKHGGQNPLEPAAFGKCVIFGPHMFNFRSIVEALVKNDAAVQIRDERDLVRELLALLSDTNRMRDIGWNAKRTLIASRGATSRNLEIMRKITT